MLSPIVSPMSAALVLRRSLGPELVLAGPWVSGFGNGVVTTPGNDLLVTNDGTGAVGRAVQAVSTVAGSRYLLRFNILAMDASSAQIYATPGIAGTGGALVGTFYGAIRFEQEYVATTSYPYISLVTTDGSASAKFVRWNNVSLREILKA